MMEKKAANVLSDTKRIPWNGPNAFFLEIGPNHPLVTLNNVETYTFVTLFSGKVDTPPPSVLRNTWMAPNASRW